MQYLICSIILPNRELERDFNEQTYTLLKLCLRRRLHNKCIGAFAGLAGYMAGLRFSYVRKFSADLLNEG